MVKMSEQFLNFEYEGSIVPFVFTGNDVMINATEMVKLFPGKKMNHFLSNNQTTELVNQLESDAGIPASELIRVVKGGIPQEQGTWMHRKIAIAFAMWLSPKFYSWCLGKIDEIINQGYAFRDAEIQKRDIEIQKLQGEVGNLSNILQSQAPQVSYYNNVLTYSGLAYSTEEICKSLGLGCGPKELLKRLENFGYIYRRGKIWHLSSKFDDCGYTVSTTKLVKSKKTGKEFAKPVKKWTESGKHWIWSLKNKLGF